MEFYLIHPREISALVREKRAIIIDVREREAYRIFHYRNARNYPYEEIMRHSLCLPRNGIYILYCDYGSTSLLAARQLSKEGYEVYSVVGGMEAIKNYQRTILPETKC